MDKQLKLWSYGQKEKVTDNALVSLSSKLFYYFVNFQQKNGAYIQKNSVF